MSVIPPWLVLRARSSAISWGHSVVCFKVDESGLFKWKSAVLPKFRQRESGLGKSWCISSTLQDNNYAQLGHFW